MYNIISVNGQKAVDYGYSVSKGKCYGFIRNNNCDVRAEVVIDDNGCYDRLLDELADY